MAKKIDNDLKGLTKLGRTNNTPSRALETFPNRTSERPYVITLETREFTCNCPLTGQPDFATIRIQYVPDKKIVESKSLKLYFWSFRNEGVFHEHVTNVILKDLVKALSPKWCRVTGDFSPRGGIGIKVVAEHNPKNAPRADLLA